ncbi:trimeric intracellular cation channel family protein [Rudanella paleaurantiibacter]|uniref:Trimeric intracellular cation channel family protein n=1 Tax=Rudanella paleaurantiibacter TaxID=2614655 RepID=A0A7J5TY68_9BACT|nr:MULTISPECIES: trimeric intracellular cation channel family protein [Rudanella]KAB7728668.1 trimeric intracellular cation channel family protein [Rudanella paleaurantiibacter]
MTIWYLTDLIGTSVFAISGALSALQKKMYHDLFSIFFVGFVTAIGGGTLRDIIMGAHPIAWIRDPNYLVVIIASVLIAVLCRTWWLGMLRRPLLIFDTLGIGIYTILGMQKALAHGVNEWAAILLGLISALFGGVIRDTLVNDLPLIFDRQLYATPCLAGAILYLAGLALGLDTNLNFVLSAGTITLFRLVAIRKGWSLPRVE